MSSLDEETQCVHVYQSSVLIAIWILASSYSCVSSSAPCWAFSPSASPVSRQTQATRAVPLQVFGIVVHKNGTSITRHYGPTEAAKLLNHSLILL